MCSLFNFFQIFYNKMLVKRTPDLSQIPDPTASAQFPGLQTTIQRLQLRLLKPFISYQLARMRAISTC